MDEIEHYLSNVTPGQRAEFARLRGLVLEAAPGAEEIFSYRMPGFALDGKTLIWVGAFKRHMSIFPGTSGSRTPIRSRTSGSARSSASDSRRSGRPEERHATIYGRGEIAQLVEHTTENRGVPGSSPGLAIAALRRRSSV